MTKQQEIDRLRSAISWLEPPFVDENTSHEVLRTRVNLMLVDVHRIDRALQSKVTAA